MNNCKNNELIEKAKGELYLLKSKEIQQAYRDANLIPPIIVGESERSEREILLRVTRKKIESNENLAFSIHSAVMQKTNGKNIEKILMDERISKMLNGIEILDIPEIVNMLRENNIELLNDGDDNFEFLLKVIYKSCLIDETLIDKFNTYINKKSMELCKKAGKVYVKDLKEFGGNNMNEHEKIRKRTIKVCEYLDKLSYEEVCNILKQSNRIIQVPNESDLFSRNVLNELACQACLIDKKILVNFEMAIAEKFENRIQENVKNYGDKILTTPLLTKISNNLDKMQKEVAKQMGDKHFTVYPEESRNMKDSAEEMKKEMNEKYTDDIKDIIRYITRDNYDNREIDELKTSESDKKLKEDLDRLGKLFNIKCHENFVNTIQEKLNERTTTIDEDQEINRDCNDEALEDCVRTIVLNNKYFDSELTAELYNRSCDYPMEVVNDFFQDYIDYIELDKLYAKEEDYYDTINDQEDLNFKVIDAVTDFIFESDDRRYLIEFIIRLYKYYTK